MDTIEDWIDATEGRTFRFRPINCLHVKPRDPYMCAGARMIRYEDKTVKDARVSNEYTWIWHKGQKLPIKYANSKQMKRIAQLNDTDTRKELLDEIRAFFEVFGGEAVIPIRLLPIPKGRTKEKLRSEKMKEYRRTSNQRRIENARKGIPPRKYKSPVSLGLRSMIGQSHTWHGKE